jgi:hypothetical protein
MIDGFNESRIVLEIVALLADLPGIIQLDGIRNVHVLMRYNGRPVVTEDNDRQDISQNDVYNNPGSERDKRFDTSIGKFAESCRKPDAQEAKGKCPGPQRGTQ